MSGWEDLFDDVLKSFVGGSAWGIAIDATVPWPLSSWLSGAVNFDNPVSPTMAAVEQPSGGAIIGGGEVVDFTTAYFQPPYGYGSMGLDPNSTAGGNDSAASPWDNGAGAKDAWPDWPTTDPFGDVSKRDPVSGRALFSDPDLRASNDVPPRGADTASDAPSYTPQQYDDMLRGKWTYVGSSPVSGSPGVYVDVYQMFDAEGVLQTTYRSQQPQPDRQGYVFEAVDVTITLDAKSAPQTTSSSTQAVSEPANSLPANPFPNPDSSDPLPENPFQARSETPGSGQTSAPTAPVTNPPPPTSTTGDAPAPFDPMADNPFAKWLLYATDTPIRDWLTNDSNLHAIQLGAAGVAVGALTVATGGAAGGLAAGALGDLGIGLSAAETAVLSGAASGVAGGVEFRSGVAALAYADTNLLNVGAPGPQLDPGDAVNYVFDPQAMSTDALLGGGLGALEHAAPLIGRGAAQLFADTEGSIGSGRTPAGEVSSAGGQPGGVDAPSSGTAPELPSALSDGPWGGGPTSEAPNRSTVPLPAPGESRMNFGTRAHQELPRIIEETNPGAGGSYRVAPGLTGPDLVNPTGMNAKYAEMKSLWGRQAPMLKQAERWGFDASEGRYFFYDRETGVVFEGIIQTDKLPSGRFR